MGQIQINEEAILTEVVAICIYLLCVILDIVAGDSGDRKEKGSETEEKTQSEWLRTTYGLLHCSQP